MQAVVITGLAHGIGREVARLLARSKVPVAGFDVDADGIESLKKELEEARCDCLLTTLDITDRPGILAFRDAVLAKFGRVDAVLSNVGIDCFGPFEELDLDKALKWLEINVVGAAAIFQAFLPSMRENRNGKLIQRDHSQGPGVHVAQQSPALSGQGCDPGAPHGHRNVTRRRRFVQPRAILTPGSLWPPCWPQGRVAPVNWNELVKALTEQSGLASLRQDGGHIIRSGGGNRRGPESGGRRRGHEAFSTAASLV
jgi:NAD(P)-dependent dehydrogenase (short-subunit alcohol dehydrogenase family)